VGTSAPDADDDPGPDADSDRGPDFDRLRATWKRTLSLSWPVTAEHVLRTLMRTTDVLVTGSFSPAAVAAIGLADLYARLPLRIGLGLGGGAIALSSQDTGRGAEASRDEAITQALLLGVLAGVPFVAFGVLFGRAAIGFLGAPPAVAAMGGTYLAVIFATAPARHVALVGARALQGTGDTLTPMYVNVLSNALNIAGSVGLGLGLGGLPRLGIVGVGAATAATNVFTAGALLVAIGGTWSEASLTRPSNPIITRQLIRVAVPRIAEGLATTLAEFPFNALLLGLGTEVNAAFQIGRRLYQQVTAPLSRGYNVAASVLVGQSLGEGDPGESRFRGWAIAALGVFTVGAIGAGLFLAAPSLVGFFTDDAATARYAVGFARVYAVTAAFLVSGLILSGALQGASETRVPFAARVTASFGFLLGLSTLLVNLGWGVLGVYVGIGLAWVWTALVVAAGFRWGDWAGRAADMMAERSEHGADIEDTDAESDA
jgi:putative MATE family efflux protein